MDDLKKELSNLIENNKIEQAIKLLKEESSKSGGKLDHVIISLSSRFKRYKEKSLMGLESREQEFTKIVSDALELVKVIDDPSKLIAPDVTTSSSHAGRSHSAPPSSSSGQSNKYVQMGIGGLAVIGIIALIAVFAGGGEGEDTGYDETYIESDGSQSGAGGVYDVSGSWRQSGQSFGPEYDCPECSIGIVQEGESIAVTSNEGWYADLFFDNVNNIFSGELTWGEASPNDPPQATVLFWDYDNNELVIQTFIQGAEYNLYYQP